MCEERTGEANNKTHESIGDVGQSSEKDPLRYKFPFQHTCCKDSDGSTFCEHVLRSKKSQRKNAANVQEGQELKLEQNINDCMYWLLVLKNQKDNIVIFSNSPRLVACFLAKSYLLQLHKSEMDCETIRFHLCSFIKKGLGGILINGYFRFL